ncbi:MAG TPA: ECF-type sigma factor [Vicinamibacterales bacterium]|jgi:RNA polymerase sigma factor (TIGR02999 family)
MAADATLTSLIAAAQDPSRADTDALFSALYTELHRLARAQLARQGHSGLLGATTLLHESYLEMAGRQAVGFADGGRFMGYAARVMRGLIVDHVRRRQAVKRGGGCDITSSITDLVDGAGELDLVRVGDALDDLAAIDPPLAEVVDLKFFCGFTVTEVAAMRGVSERTVQRQWEKARLYLHRVLAGPARV